MTVIHWNGHDVPPELRALPAGTYAIQETAEELALSAEEDAGLVEALRALQSGKGIAHDDLRTRILRHV
jgi:hypothetical protein